MNSKLTLAMACIMLLTSSSMLAQSSSGFDNMMLSNGKLYTVVGVLVIIFLGIILYLFNTDKKLKSLENQIKSE